MMTQDVKHLFVCPAHPTTMTPSDLWSRPADAVRELSHLEARDPDRNEHGLKGEQQQWYGDTSSYSFVTSHYTPFI